MNGSIKNMLVGVFILGAVAICIASILFLKPHVGDGKQTLYVRFSDIGSLNVGTRVLFAGKPVGEVVAMHEIHNAREQPTDQLGRVYFYQLTLKIDSGVRVYNTDEIAIATSGLLGEKSIAITPKAPPQGVAPILITHQPIYADSIDILQNALVDFSDLAASMEETFKQLTNWVKDHGEEVATTVRSAGAAMDEVRDLADTVNQSKLVHDIQAGVRSFHTVLTQVETSIKELEAKNTFQNLGSTIQSLKSASHSVDLMANNMAQAKGTLGKLIGNDDLYLQMNAIMSKGNTLMNDVNQYGVLFHLNKQWQRTRLQRAHLISALEDPSSFRTYFENEIEGINSSMARLSKVLYTAEESPNRAQILKTAGFKQDFAELLRKANELSDNLQLYNQQLNEAVEK